jgi:hypothetical protein
MDAILLSLIHSMQSSLQKEIFYVVMLICLWIVTDTIGKIRKFLENRKKKKTAKFEYSLAKHNKIESTLYDLLYAADADRVYLAQLHNGEITSAKMHMYKVSVSHEVCRPGVSREKDSIKNIQVQDHLKAMNILVRKDIIAVDDVGGLQPNLTRALLQSLNVSSGLYMAIRDREQTMVGFLALEFVDTPFPVKVSEDKELTKLFQREASILQLNLLD